MSLHVLTEFGRGGYKSSGWDWQSCPRSLGPPRSGCKVAIYAATPGREGSADLEIMTLPPLLRFTLTISPHDPIFLCPSLCVKSLAVLPCLWQYSKLAKQPACAQRLFIGKTKERLSICIEYSGNKSHLLKATLTIHETNYLAANRSPMLVTDIFHLEHTRSRRYGLSFLFH